MKEISSSKVKLYPSAYRGPNPVDGVTQYNPEANLLTENNLSSITQNITERAFVITNEFEETKSLEFSMLGRYFNLENFNLSDVLESSESNIWVSIKIKSQLSRAVADNANTSYPNWVLVTYDNESTPLDADEKFKALHFSEEKPNTTDTATLKHCSLHLLTKVDNVWIIPEESHLKLSPEDIKGGEDNSEEKSLKSFLDTKKIKADELTSHNPSTSGLIISTNTEVGNSYELKAALIKGNAAGDVKLSIDGSTSLTGYLSVSDNISAEKNLSAGKDLEVGENASIQGTLAVEGDISSNSDIKAQNGEVSGKEGNFEDLTANAIESETIKNSSDIINEGKIVNKGNIFTKTFSAGGTAEDNARVSISATGKSTFADSAEFKSGIKLSTMSAEVGGLSASGNDINFGSAGNINITTGNASGSKVNISNILNVGNLVTSSYGRVSAVNSSVGESVPNIDWVGKNTASKIYVGKGALSQSICLGSANGDENNPLSSANLRKLIVDIVYPVGSIYITTSHYLSNATCMNEAFGGTWRQIDGDAYLKSIYSSQTPGKYNSATLPNIKGRLSDIEIHKAGSGTHPSIFEEYIGGAFGLPYEDGEHINYWASGNNGSGYTQSTLDNIHNTIVRIGDIAHATIPGLGDAIEGLTELITGTGTTGSGAGSITFRQDDTAKRYLEFDASKSNATYQDNASVNPYHFTVYMFERIK